MMDNRNLAVTLVISLLILLGYEYFYERPRLQMQHAIEQAELAKQAPPADSAAAPTPGAATVKPDSVPALNQAAPAVAKDRDQSIASSPRVHVQTPRVTGSIDLLGGRLDDYTLTGYRETVDLKSPNITLLNPSGLENAYFTEFGWIAPDAATKVPDRTTKWTADRDTLTPNQPVTLAWDNGEGQRFLRQYSIDGDFLVTVVSRVENKGDKPVSLIPYSLVSRLGTPKTQGYTALHEGYIAVINGHVADAKYGSPKPGEKQQDETTGGWLGLTDKYWLVALVPDQAMAVKTRFTYDKIDGLDHYQVDYLGTALTAPAGGAIDTSERVFVGAKEVKLLQRYESAYHIPLFDYAVDWGWFFFFTRPIFSLLDYIYSLVGNFGIAILLLTVTIKAVFFPLANRSYASMSKMKALAPKMKELKEKYGEDKVRLNQETMALYKKEKINPLSGCLPILLQIPVFFSLYKVLLITIEMRHAPFFGWIQDLSAPDPTVVWNLFGLIPWDPTPYLPHLLLIGAWPLAMGASMFLQQRLSPQPPDPTQAKVMMFMPLIFMTTMASFPAGLVVYWTWNNALSIAQQWVIMRRSGVA
jgi:YidC/Oxa1 family membrane protein insertase